MKIRHIFFDLDNTLWDHNKNARLTLEELFEDHKIQESFAIPFNDFYEVYHEINEDLWIKIRDGIIDKDYLRKHRFYDTFLKFNLDDFELSQTFEHQFLDEIVKYNELVPGSLDILEYLKKKGYTIHIISNGFRDVTHRKVEESGIKAYITTITSADDVGVRKPNPKVFNYAINLAKATKQESIIIGDDWVADIKGAKDFGIDAIYFNPLNEFSVASEITTIKKLEELSQYL